MRILNVTQSYAPFYEFGGPPEKVKALSEGLAALGHEVTVLTADWGLQQRIADLPGEAEAEDSPFGKKSQVAGVKAVYLPNWGHYRAASWNPALPRFLRARLKTFHVVHIFGLYDLLGARTAARAREYGIPYVVEPIGMYVPIVRNLPLKRIYHRLVGRTLLQNAAAIVATSEQEKAELVSGGLPVQKIVLRRNGVRGPDSVPEPGFLRLHFKLPPDAKIILFLGRLSQKKSPDLLLEAFAEISSAHPFTHLIFVGPDEADMRIKLMQMAGEHQLSERVHFLGAISGKDKWSAYSDSYIFVLPSQNENFGNTAAEAVAVSIPSVLTDRCGIAPLLDGVASLVVRHDKKSIAAGINALLHDSSRYEQLKRGCTAAMQRLDWTSPTREMADLYERLAGLARS